MRALPAKRPQWRANAEWAIPDDSAGVCPYIPLGSVPILSSPRLLGTVPISDSPEAFHRWHNS